MVVFTIRLVGHRHCRRFGKFRILSETAIPRRLEFWFVNCKSINKSKPLVPNESTDLSSSSEPGTHCTVKFPGGFQTIASLFSKNLSYIGRSKNSNV